MQIIDTTIMNTVTDNNSDRGGGGGGERTGWLNNIIIGIPFTTSYSCCLCKLLK